MHLGTLLSELVFLRFLKVCIFGSKLNLKYKNIEKLFQMCFLNKRIFDDDKIIFSIR